MSTTNHLWTSSSCDNVGLT